MASGEQISTAETHETQFGDFVTMLRVTSKEFSESHLPHPRQPVPGEFPLQAATGS